LVLLSCLPWCRSLVICCWCRHMPNWRFERDATTAGFAACYCAPQAKR
jgi:hypothetical protein